VHAAQPDPPPASNPVRQWNVDRFEYHSLPGSLVEAFNFIISLVAQQRAQQVCERVMVAVPERPNHQWT